MSIGGEGQPSPPHFRNDPEGRGLTLSALTLQLDWDQAHALFLVLRDYCDGTNRLWEALQPAEDEPGGLDEFERVRERVRTTYNAVMLLVDWDIDIANEAQQLRRLREELG